MFSQGPLPTRDSTATIRPSESVAFPLTTKNPHTVSPSTGVEIATRGRRFGGRNTSVWDALMLTKRGLSANSSAALTSTDVLFSIAEALPKYVRSVTTYAPQTPLEGVEHC